MRKVLTGFVVCIAFSHISSSQLRQVVISNSQVQTITSAIVNQEYELQVYLPPAYENSTKKYPVLYLLDSQWDFPLVTSICGQQYYDGFIPELIIVGITWGGTRPNADSLRARDYTPTNDKRTPQSGGAARFITSLQREIIPFIEAKYRTKSNDRTLMGCSLGGLFTLYALFTSPELFQRYIATTPAISWNNEVIYLYEKAYFEKQLALPAKLFITMGEMERALPAFEKLLRHLSSRNYKELHIKTRILENTAHSGNKAEGYTRGLQYVFERPVLQLRHDILMKYIGKYKSDKGTVIEIKMENNGLVAYFSNDNYYKLLPASENSFYTTSDFLNLSFVRENNIVSSVQMERYGSLQSFAKIK